MAIRVSSPNIDNTDISFQKRDYHSWHSGRFHALDNKYNTAISRYLFKLFLDKALLGKVENCMYLYSYKTRLAGKFLCQTVDDLSKGTATDELY